MQVKKQILEHGFKPNFSKFTFIKSLLKKNILCSWMLLITLFLSTNLVSATPIINGVTVADDITTRLTAYGFENVATVVDGKQVIITYENRAYRFEVEGIKEITKMIMPLIQDKYENLILVVQNKQIPVVYVDIPVSAYKDFMNEKISGDEFSDLMIASIDTDIYKSTFSSIEKQNSSMLKFDLEIVPQLGLALGAKDDAFKHVINIAPKLSTTLWKGFTLTAQLIQPLSNELDISYEDYTRAGLITANHLFRLPSSIFASVTLGYFTNNVYGADLELGKFFLNDKLLIKAEISYTGNMMYLKDGEKSIWVPGNVYSENTVEYSDLYYFSGNLGLSYNLPQYDLTLGVSYGRFLYFEDAWKFEATRKFDEFNIGFLATSTEDGNNVGFTMAIPIYPKKYSTKRFRIRPSNYFSYNYFANNYQVFKHDNGRQFDKLFENLNPYFIKNQLSENINW